MFPSIYNNKYGFLIRQIFNIKSHGESHLTQRLLNNLSVIHYIINSHIKTIFINNANSDLRIKKLHSNDLYILEYLVFQKERVLDKNGEENKKETNKIREFS